jgi:hypothetical protein
MAAYRLDIFDNDGNEILPGLHMVPENVLFYSTFPIPVPDVGETLEVFRKKWRVNRRVFNYAYENEDRGDREPAVTVTLFCSPEDDVKKEQSRARPARSKA